MPPQWGSQTSQLPWELSYLHRWEIRQQTTAGKYTPTAFTTIQLSKDTGSASNFQPASFWPHSSPLFVHVSWCTNSPLGSCSPWGTSSHYLPRACKLLPFFLHNGTWIISFISCNTSQCSSKHFTFFATCLMPEGRLSEGRKSHQCWNKAWGGWCLFANQCWSWASFPSSSSSCSPGYGGKLAHVSSLEIFEKSCFLHVGATGTIPTSSVVAVYIWITAILPGPYKVVCKLPHLFPCLSTFDYLQ